MAQTGAAERAVEGLRRRVGACAKWKLRYPCVTAKKFMWPKSCQGQGSRLAARLWFCHVGATEEDGASLTTQRKAFFLHAAGGFLARVLEHKAVTVGSLSFFASGTLSTLLQASVSKARRSPVAPIDS